MRFYIAAPFFNPKQVERVEVIKEMLTKEGLDYFSPKDDCLFENSKGMDSGAIFRTNIDEIDRCDGMIVITDDKDPGSMFEAGYAYGSGSCNSIYVWIDYDKDASFNLMLAHSADAVALGYGELARILKSAQEDGGVATHNYSGKME